MSTNTAPPPVASALTPVQGALVIGASSGIGAAIAERLAREGYRVALVARRADALESIAATINAAAPDRARAYPHDVTRYAQAPDLFQTILRDLERLDVVVYAAGVQAAVEFSEYDFAKDQPMLETNLLGAIAWLNLAATLFERQGHGHLVGISSIAGERGRVGNPVYNATKAGLNTYLEALRNRLTRAGVHVLTVKPGFVATDLLKLAPRTFWVVQPAQVAKDVWQAIRARRQSIFVPARWVFVALAIRHVPSVIFRRLKF